MDSTCTNGEDNKCGTSEHIIEVEGLCYGYSEDCKVLHDISFCIDEPGFISIIGPNGVGKSTMIKCINGIIKPTSGTVRILGRPVEDYNLKDLARIVGYVPVISGDYLKMTVLDTVLIGRYSHQRWKTTDEDILMAHKALKAMEIDDLAMRGFDELSAGQHQKVSIARGLVQKPRIMILDEPTSNLDIRHQVFVSAFLKKLAARTGMVILMISHDLNLAAKFSDRIIVMGAPGRIYGIGTPDEMITEDMIRDVYDVQCSVVTNHGSPHVILESVMPLELDDPNGDVPD